MPKKNSQARLGFIQAFEVAAYCLGIGLFIWNGEKIFQRENYFLASGLFLILFSVSALICGLLVFYRPYKIFLDGKKKEAVDLVLATTAWLFVFMLLLLFVVLALTLR
jgi:uncharacterized membrane protein YidH (DUF202 family)